MITPNFTINDASMNAVKARVELFEGSALVKTCTCSDVLQSFTIDRNEENNKFFGFGVCQSIKTILIDLNRELNITNNMTIAPSFGDGTNFINPYPTFYIKDVVRDEDTNGLTITAYDKIYDAGMHTIDEVNLGTSYTINDVAVECAAFLGLSGIEKYEINDTCFDTNFADGANLDGTETIRQVLDAIAEATQTIYYISNNKYLVFKRLSNSTSEVFYITKDKYFSLKTSDAVVLDAICHYTDLGDNVITKSRGDENGVIQYVRNNPFWDNRTDIDTLLDNAWNAVGGLTINQFICDSWEGNYLLEVGDKIGIYTEDNTIIRTFVLNDSIVFDGTLEESTEWIYSANENDTAANPASLGEALNQTFAKVDKVNKQINLVVSDVDSNKERLSIIEVNTSGINATIQTMQKEADDAHKTMSDNFETLSKQVSLKMDDEAVRIKIEREMAKGVDKVKTEKGFTFDDSGLNITEAGSEMTTLINHDGMKVSRGGQETLVANNIGVNAENLHATTYLRIGTNSRLSDWSDRAACFWVGG
jgi:hypothetical protein